MKYQRVIRMRKRLPLLSSHGLPRFRAVFARRVANHLPTTTAAHSVFLASSALQPALERRDLARLALGSTATIGVRFPLALPIPHTLTGVG